MNKRAGFSLVEVTVALGLAAFCLTTLMGLIPAGLRSNQCADERYVASEVATQLISDLANTPIGTIQQVDNLTIPTAGSAANATSQEIFYSPMADAQGNHFANARTQDSRYLVSVSIQAPDANQMAATNVHIRITWPAAANPNLPAGSLEVFTALNRN